MPTPQRYAKILKEETPLAPGFHSDEYDSDIELELQEFGPLPANEQRGDGRINSPTSAQPVQERLENGKFLRSLRMGRSRRVESRDSNLYVAVESADAGNVPLSHGDDNITSEDSRGEFSGLNDEAPLLKQNEHVNLEVGGNTSSRWKLLSLLRMPGDTSGGLSRPSPRPRASKEAQNREASRYINIGEYSSQKFPPNAVSNAKYTAWSFLPQTLYNEFSFFYNLYFLLVALSQIIPALRIGFLSTYIYPLAFVLAITLGKEALDDLGRRKRDSEANMEEYTVIRLRKSLQDSSFGSKTVKGSKAGAKRAKGKSHTPRHDRLDSIEEEEDSMGGEHSDPISNIEISELKIRSRDLKVGDILKLGKDQRIPADLVILKSYTTESEVKEPPTQHLECVTTPPPDLVNNQQSVLTADEMNSKFDWLTDNSGRDEDIEVAGETFIRTDQLDGETDWKLRTASPLTQSLDPRNFIRISIVAAKPDRKVNEFYGKIEYNPPQPKAPTEPVQSGTQSPRDLEVQQVAPLTIDNTAWANTVLASNAIVLAAVIYTGAQTRQALSTSTSRSKTGLLDYEINNLTKILFALTLTLSVTLVALEGFNQTAMREAWYIAIPKFLILFSTIIPVSLRVNLDMGKSVFAWFIERDQGIPNTVVRTSTIPEELGRIEYLLSDKTGTLTQNGKYPQTHPVLN